MKRVQSRRTGGPRWAGPWVPAVVRPACTGGPGITASRCTTAPAWAAAGSRRRCWASPGRRPSSALPWDGWSQSGDPILQLVRLSRPARANKTPKTPKPNKKIEAIAARTLPKYTDRIGSGAIDQLSMGWDGFGWDRWTGCYSLLVQRTTKRWQPLAEASSENDHEKWTHNPHTGYGYCGIGMAELRKRTRDSQIQPCL